MARSTALLGYALLAGAAITGFVAYRDEAGWAGELRNLTTSGGSGSKAQVLANLRAREADLTQQLEAAEADVETEFSRRMARANFDTLSGTIEAECSGWSLNHIWNPYGECDDRIVQAEKDEARTWRERALAREVAPIRAELETVRAEIDSLHLAA